MAGAGEKRRALIAAAVFVTAVAALAYRVLLRRPAGPRPGKRTADGAALAILSPAGAAELAILSPLRVGSQLAACTIGAIDLDNGTISIACVCGSAPATLRVAMASADGPSPAATAGPYAIYYSASPSAGDLTPVCASLAAVLTANVSSPPPPDLGPYVASAGAMDPQGESAPPRPPAPAGRAELSMVAPLRVGSLIDDCTVRRIDAVRDGTVSLECARGSTLVALQIAVLSPGSPPPPARSSRYGVYYAAPRTAGDLTPLCAALARVLDANASVRAAPGMGAFRGPPQPAADGGACLDPDAGPSAN